MGRSLDARTLIWEMSALDAVIKPAARFEVVNVISHEPRLEEIFLAYYNRGENHAA